MLYRVPAPRARWLIRHRLSPRETVAVVIFGEIVADGGVRPGNVAGLAAARRGGRGATVPVDPDGVGCAAATLGSALGSDLPPSAITAGACVAGAGVRADGSLGFAC